MTETPTAELNTRQDNYLLESFQQLEGHLQAIRRRVMQLAAEKAAAQQPEGIYTVTVEHQNAALSELFSEPGQLRELVGLPSQPSNMVMQTWEEEEGDDAQKTHARLSILFRDLQGDLSDILPVVGSALSCEHAKEIFEVVHPHQRSLGELQQDFAYLQEHRNDPDVTNQENYIIRVNRLLHAVSVAILVGKFATRH